MDYIREQAKANTRNTLRAIAGTFSTLPLETQTALYRDTFEQEHRRLLQANNPAYAEAKGSVGASKNIDESRHEKGFKDTIDAFHDLQEGIDFPKFVKDLMWAVFDGNIKVMKAQTDEYMKLMKAATTDLATFIKAIDDTAAMAKLAENKPDQFNLAMTDEDDGNGGTKGSLSLTDPSGEAIDKDDAAIKAQLMQMKIQMAQEHRTALREMILMGITRLVVEKGKIKASVLFDVAAKRDVKKQDKAINQVVENSMKEGRIGGGFFGGLFGGPSGSLTSTKSETNISVSSAKSDNSDDIKAKLSGEVEIQFKTDYFKLDNFATMYGPGLSGAQPVAGPPAAGAPAIPALPTAARPAAAVPGR